MFPVGSKRCMLFVESLVANLKVKRMLLLDLFWREGQVTTKWTLEWVL
jgi:hypothetical protein